MAGANFLTAYISEKDFTCEFTFNKFAHLYIFHWFCSVNERFYDVDDALILFDFKADLTKLFDWNTHMIFAWISVEYNNTKSVFLIKS